MRLTFEIVAVTHRPEKREFVHRRFSDPRDAKVYLKRLNTACWSDAYIRQAYIIDGTNWIPESEEAA